ncbi:MAG: hypothetical protein D3913_08910 [Candidatus Electrothrix sp. LOE1_4_5]|nr:hypothetical protein [Candidatus Electrothrix gigas]
MNREVFFDVAVDFLVFIFSVVVLSYTSANQYWVAFWITAVISAAVYLLVLYKKIVPLHERINRLITKNAGLAAKAEKYGIVDFYNMQDVADKEERNTINGRIIEEGNFFGLLCETGNSYFNPEFDRHWSVIKRRLERHDTINLLIINPFSKSKCIRKELGIGGDIDLERVNELVKKYPSLDVRFTDEVYCSVFFSEKEMIYDPYHLTKIKGVSENHMLALYLKKQENRSGPCHYEILKEHFNHLWAHGTTLPQLMQATEAQPPC